jgi:hypothetical protein
MNHRLVEKNQDRLAGRNAAMEYTLDMIRDGNPGP